MQQDIRASFDLPLRLAIVEAKGGCQLIHPTAEDFSDRYAIAGNHPVLEAVTALFDDLQSDFSATEGGKAVT